jgi:hypothetical protein
VLKFRFYLKETFEDWVLNDMPLMDKLIYRAIWPFERTVYSI